MQVSYVKYRWEKCPILAKICSQWLILKLQIRANLFPRKTKNWLSAKLTPAKILCDTVTPLVPGIIACNNQLETLVLWKLTDILTPCTARRFYRRTEGAVRPDKVQYVAYLLKTLLYGDLFICKCTAFFLLLSNFALNKITREQRRKCRSDLERM